MSAPDIVFTYYTHKRDKKLHASGKFRKNKRAMSFPHWRGQCFYIPYILNATGAEKVSSHHNKNNKKIRGLSALLPMDGLWS
jgi:hypothetical protein